MKTEQTQAIENRLMQQSQGGDTAMLKIEAKVCAGIKIGGNHNQGGLKVKA